MHLATLALAAALVSLPAAAQMSMPMDKPMAKPGMMEKKAAVPSTSLTLVIASKTVTLTLAQLAALPHKSVTVHNIHSKLDETYSGVALADLLAANGAPFTKETQNKMLKSYIVATGTDGYNVIYSTVEVFSEYHTGDVLIADTRDGKPIAPDGALKLISTEDKHPMRWVQNLAKITLVATNF